jgi:hypothetical protein
VFTVLKLFAAALALMIVGGALIKIVGALREMGRVVWRLLAVTVIIGVSASLACLFAFAFSEFAPDSTVFHESGAVWAGLLSFPLILGLALVLEQRGQKLAQVQSVWTPDPSVQVSVSSHAASGVGQAPRPPRKTHWNPWSKEARTTRAARLADKERGDAWLELQERADWAPARVAIVRRSCESFLMAVAEAPPDAQLIHYSVALRKRIPEVIENLVRHSVGASISEQRHLTDEALDQLETLAAQAERLRSKIQVLRIESSSVMRAYIDQLVRSDELQL